MKEHKLKLEETKNGLEACLKKNDQITCDGQTPFAVKLKFLGFNIDLLPTFTTDPSRGKIDFNLPFNLNTTPLFVRHVETVPFCPASLQLVAVYRP